MRRTRTLFPVLIFLLSVIFSTVVDAASGDLDVTFGVGGKVTTDVNGNDSAKAVKIQPDGKILVAGSSSSLFLLRYNSDGSLDTTFGTNGKIISNNSQTAFSLGAFQADNKLVTCVIRTPVVFPEAQFRRFNSDGTLDTSFGTNGLVTIMLGQSSPGFDSLTVAPNGTIVTVGSSLVGSNTSLYILRLNSDGSLPNTSLTYDAYEKRGTSVIVEPDGKMFVGGTYSSATGQSQYGFCLRFNAAGTIDGSVQNIPFPVRDLAIQTDGKILVSGTRSNNLAVARYNADLSPDTNFGANGVGIADFGDSTSGNDIVVQNNGTIVVGGTIGVSNNSNFALARFQPNGILDFGFGINGKVSTSFGNTPSELVNIFPSADDKILATGLTTGTNRDVVLTRYLAGVTTSTQNRVKYDFDGDGRADVSVFRPSSGTWYLNQSANGFTGVAFGFGTDVIVPADFDADGKTDVAVFRPSNGTWYIQRSTAGFTAVTFGQNGDIPVPGDYDDDGKADISVFRPSNGAWYRINSSSGQFSGLIFGQNGDVPLIADFNGDSISDITVFRPANGNFYWIDSITQQFHAVQFGLGTDIPVLADFDGDGLTDISVFRPSYEPYYTGESFWLRLNSGNNQLVQIPFGQNGDVPVAADYDGNGKTDIAVFRPTNGNWFFNDFAGILFGASGDKPIQSAF